MLSKQSLRIYFYRNNTFLSMSTRIINENHNTIVGTYYNDVLLSNLITFLGIYYFVGCLVLFSRFDLLKKL